MLSTAVYQDLGRLTRLIFLVFTRIEGGAQSPEAVLGYARDEPALLAASPENVDETGGS